MPALLFEREGSTNILVSGGEGRTAARRNVLVTTDYKIDHRRWSAVCHKKQYCLPNLHYHLVLDHTAQPPARHCTPSPPSNIPFTPRCALCFARTPHARYCFCCLACLPLLPCSGASTHFKSARFACLSAPLRSIPVRSRSLPMRKSKPHDQPDAELFCALRLLLLRRFAVNTGRSAFILSHSQYRTGSRTTFLPPFLSRLAAVNGGAVTRMTNCGMKNEIMQ